MKCRRFFLRRRFVSYLEGDASPRLEKRLERHLAGCPECGRLLATLRAGHEAARRFGRPGPAAPGYRPPEFAELWAKFGAENDGQDRPGRAGIFRGLPAPLAVKALVVLALASAGFLVVSHRGLVWRSGSAASVASTADFHGFTPVSIRDFTSDTKASVVTEGVVGSVYFDEEEQTLHIKLLGARHKLEPFVICEVRQAGGMTIPPEGSRVRVYGTARYDDQPGRGWHEVNPVVNIDVLKR
jgi:hypothetical protein